MLDAKSRRRMGAVFLFHMKIAHEIKVVQRFERLLLFLLINIKYYYQ